MTTTTVGDIATIPASTGAAALGLATLALGSVGPWATVLGLTIDGTSVARGDGKLTLALAVVAALLLATRRRLGIALATATTVAAAAIAGYDFARIQRIGTGSGILRHVHIHVVTAGWGIYATLLGAVMATVALGAEYVNGR